MIKSIFLNFKAICFIAALFVFSVTLAGKKNKQTAIDRTLSKYSNAAGVKIKFSKTDLKKSLGIKKTVSGVMQYSNNKINIILNDEKKLEIIYNGNNLWLIESPDLDFEPKAKRKVTQVKEQKPVLAQQIVGLFQKPSQFSKTFKIISEKTQAKLRTVTLETSDKNIQNFEVTFDESQHLIKSIRFVDEVQTDTTIEFLETEFLKKSPQGIFEYKRKKDDEVL